MSTPLASPRQAKRALAEADATRVMSRYDDMPADQLYKLRLMLEDLDEDTRELIETKWPWLASKLSAKGPPS